MKVFQEKAPAKDRPTVDSMIELLKVAKQDASYWLGLVAFEHRNFPAAADYLKTRDAHRLARRAVDRRHALQPRPGL